MRARVLGFLGSLFGPLGDCCRPKGWNPSQGARETRSRPRAFPSVVWIVN